MTMSAFTPDSTIHCWSLRGPSSAFVLARGAALLGALTRRLAQRTQPFTPGNDSQSFLDGSMFTQPPAARRVPNLKAREDGWLFHPSALTGYRSFRLPTELAPACW